MGGKSIDESIVGAEADHAAAAADNKTQGLAKYRIYTGDLELLIPNWKAKIDTADPCADYDHKAQGLPKYRVYTNDLQKLIDNWKKKDAELLGDCPRPDGE